jgi:hypothetical protein
MVLSFSPLVDGFKNGSNALAAADTHRHEGKLSANPLEFVQRLDGHDCAGCTQGMA